MILPIIVSLLSAGSLSQLERMETLSCFDTVIFKPVVAVGCVLAQAVNE